jgi:transcriptional regulator with XRE-family HTH domain
MEVERRTFGELLRHYRKQKGYTNLLRLAEFLGTSKDVLSNYENDKVRPGHEMLLRLINELDMPAAPALRAIGYPLDEAKVTYEDLIAEDENLVDDDAKDFVRRALQNEYERAERRQKTEKASPPKRGRRAS